MKVKVTTGNRGKFVLRWTDHNGKVHQRTTDVASTPAKRKHAYKLASELESELSGDSPPKLMIPTRQRSEESIPGITAHASLDGEWESYKAHFIATHLSGLSEGYQGTMIPILNRFERFSSPMNVKDVTASRVRLWLASLRLELKPNSVKSYWRHLSAFLSIAVSDGLIESVPKIRLPKTKTQMKGRPLSGEEFDRIKDAVDKKNRKNPDAWKWSLDALWLSGLRISEAYRITWSESGFYIDMEGKHPTYVILGDQKNKNHQRLPIVPDFADQLSKVPRRKRTGNVFSFPSQHVDCDLSFNQVKKLIQQFGNKANVKTGEGKTATAHDFRRSFGTRWALKVMPQVLQKLMRHDDISTTMRFYAHLDSDLIIESLYGEDEKGDQKGDQEPKKKAKPKSQ